MSKLFLDFDGTLVDVSERFYRIFSDFLKLKGILDVPEKDEYRKLKRRLVYDPEIFKFLGLRIEWEEYRKWKWENVEDPGYLLFDTPLCDIRDLVCKLRDKGYQVYVLTARRKPRNFWEELKRLKLHDLFDDVFITGDYSLDSKKRMIEDIVEPEDIIVGDSEMEIHAARSLGIRHMGVATGLRSADFLVEKGAELVLRDVTVLLKLL